MGENGELKMGRGVPWVVRGLPSCHGAFRQNTSVFLRRCGDEVVAGPAWPWRAWVVPLVSDNLEFRLQVYEEKTQHMSGVSCEPCRCNGWQHHPVSLRKFHFILPSERDTSLPIRVSDSAPQFTSPVGTLENKSHLLHGVIHCNGFGHLLRINGLEGGSRALTGRQVMTLWDSLCCQLQARSISIEDVSNRKGMLLRVLTPIYEKRTWYGHWDYEFGRGGYNIKKEQWLKAVDVANKAPLDKLLVDFEGVDPLLVEVVQRYKGEGEREVNTVGEWVARVCELSRSHSGALSFAAREVEEQCKATKRIPEPSTPNGNLHESKMVERSPLCNGDMGHSLMMIENPTISNNGTCGASASPELRAPIPVRVECPEGAQDTTCRRPDQDVGGEQHESCPSSTINGSSSHHDAMKVMRMKQEELVDHILEGSRWAAGGQAIPAISGKVEGVLGGRAAIDSQHLEAASGSGGSRGNGKLGNFLSFPGCAVQGNGTANFPNEAPSKSMKRKFEPGDGPSPPNAVRRSRGCAPLPETTPGVCATPKPRALAPNDPPNDLVKPNIKLFNPQSLLEGPRRYSASKLSEFMCIVLGVLQTVEGRWIRLQELRETLYTTAHDRVLADWVLGRISNTLFGGFAIYKTRSAIGRCNYFLFEKMDVSETAAVEGNDPLSSINVANVDPPGPKIVAGRSLDRFNMFLSQLYSWLCAQPGIVIGRSSNILVKEVCPPRERRKRAQPSGNGSVEVSMLHTPGVQRRTRSHSMMTAPPVWKYSKRMRVDAKSELKHRNGDIHHEKMDPWLHQYASTVEPFIQLAGQRGPQPGAAFSAKNQVLVDLLYFYQSVIEIYKPALHNFIQKNSKKVALEEFPQSIQVLKDTKLFVKEYDPIWMKRPLPGPKEGGNFIRLMCRVHLEPTVPPGHPHRTSDGSKLKLPSFFQRPPPAEPVLVADNIPREDVTNEIIRTYKYVYGMFQNWSITNVENLIYSPEGVLLPPSSEIKVVGCEYRPELELRHAGGIEDWEVYCSCQAEDDDGARMVACDSCGVWMHTRCVGFRDDEDIPEYFNCPGCIKNLHNGNMCNGT